MASLNLPELAGVDPNELAQFFETVVSPSPTKIIDTGRLVDAVKKFYSSESGQSNFLGHLFSFLCGGIFSLETVLCTFVAGDGRCIFYSGFSHFIQIGTFSLSFADVGFTEADLEDETKCFQYKEIVQQFVETECMKQRDTSIEYYNEHVREKYPYLPIVDEETPLCSPHILLHLSLIYSTVFVVIHYEDGVENPTIVNGVMDGCDINDYAFVLCKGCHAYGLFIPNKEVRKRIYLDIVSRFDVQLITMT